MGLLELSGVQHMRVGGACTGPQAAGLLSFVSALPGFPVNSGIVLPVPLLESITGATACPG